MLVSGGRTGMEHGERCNGQGSMREGKAHAAGERGGKVHRKCSLVNRILFWVMQQEKKAEKYIRSAAWLTEFYLGGVWVNGIIF